MTQNFIKQLLEQKRILDYKLSQHFHNKRCNNYHIQINAGGELETISIQDHKSQYEFYADKLTVTQGSFLKIMSLFQYNAFLFEHVIITDQSNFVLQNNSIIYKIIDINTGQQVIWEKKNNIIILNNEHNACIVHLYTLARFANDCTFTFKQNNIYQFYNIKILTYYDNN